MSATERFLSGVKSPATKTLYESRVGVFLSFAKLTPDKFATMEDGEAERLIENYIVHLKKRVEAGEISSSTIRPCVSPIRLFTLMNRQKGIDWALISKQIPHSKRYADDRTPTLEEIKALLSVSPLRLRTAILLMASTGCRLGAFDYLNVKDVRLICQQCGAPLVNDKDRMKSACGHQKTDDDGFLLPHEMEDAQNGVARVMIYAGEDEQYSSFCTPETHKTVNTYLNFRKTHGENIAPKSPLIRDVFDSAGGRGAANSPKRAPSSVLARDIQRLWHRAGTFEALGVGERRHEFKSCHGFRKWFKTQAEKTMRSIFVEMMMGHSIGVSDSYMRPKEAESLAEYRKAIPDLSIGEEERQRVQLQTMEARHEEGVGEVRLLALKKDQEVKELRAQVVALQAQLTKRPDLDLVALREDMIKTVRADLSGLKLELGDEGAWLVTKEGKKAFKVG